MNSSRSAFTLVEMLVVIAVVGLLAAILFPAMSRVRANSRTSTCASSLRQTGQALASYIADHDGVYPPCLTNKMTDKGLKFSSEWWMDIGIKPPPMCPEVDFDLLKNNSAIRRRMGTYATNLRLTKVFNPGTSKQNVIGKGESVLRYPSSTVVAFDSRPLASAMPAPDTALTKSDLRFTSYPPGWEDKILTFAPAATRHQGGANYLFGDGHVKWFRPEQLSITPQSDGVHPGFGL